MDFGPVVLGQGGMLQFLAASATRHRTDTHAAFLAYISRHLMFLRNFAFAGEKRERIRR